MVITIGVFLTLCGFSSSANVAIAVVVASFKGFTSGPLPVNVYSILWALLYYTFFSVSFKFR